METAKVCRVARRLVDASSTDARTMSASASDDGAPSDTGEVAQPITKKRTVKPLSKKKLEKHLAAAENRGTLAAFGLHTRAVAMQQSTAP